MMFQQVSASGRAHEPPRPPDAPPVVEASRLVKRYPNLSEIELARLINLYRHLSALDLALMISDQKLGPKLDHFFKDHRRHVRTPFRQYAALVAIALFGIAVTAWAVAFG